MPVLAYREPAHYDVKADRGCELAPRCLSCHVPVCKEDIPGGLPALQAERCREMVLGLRQLGWPKYVIEKRLGVSRSTVFRVLEEA